MSSDAYTKSVLTVIAAALVALVCQNAVGQSRAREASDACGRAPSDACYVTAAPSGPLYVSNVPGWYIDVRPR